MEQQQVTHIDDLPVHCRQVARLMAEGHSFETIAARTYRNKTRGELAGLTRIVREIKRRLVVDQPEQVNG